MKITIVGGGTAGWLAALIISKRNSMHDVTVVSSEKIGVIGVGESTTGLFTHVVSNEFFDLGCDIEEFIIETGATLKYSIKHKNWTPNKNQHYHGPIDGWGFTNDIPDTFLKYALGHEETPEGLLSTSQMGIYLNTGKSNFFKSGYFRDNSHAMHIDAFLAGQYFKKKCLQNNLVKHYDTEVVDVMLDEQGMASKLICSNGQTIESDFFIDCSGFSRLIMNKLGANWKGYQNHLPVKAAIPFHLDYLEGETPKPWTTAWAQSSGWMWQIPLLDRLGCGYVFDSDFITPEQAQDEVEQMLGRKINPAKYIQFNSGRQESSWIKNCVAIGLSSAFLEPLEATSIHTTLCQITWLSNEFIQTTLEDTINAGSVELYNTRVRRMFDDTKDFLVMHYMGGRTDSEFWKYISSGETRTEFVSNILEMAKSKTPTAQDFPSYYGSAGWGLYSHVMKGIGVLSSEVCKRDIASEFTQNPFSKTLIDDDYKSLKEFMHGHLEDKMLYSEFIEYFREKRL